MIKSVFNQNCKLKLEKKLCVTESVSSLSFWFGFYNLENKNKWRADPKTSSKTGSFANDV